MTAYDAAALPLGHPAVENVARRLGAAPNRKGLETTLRMLVPWKKMVRSAGLAPTSADWHSGILLLNDERERAARVTY
jgi:hypothetical protein